MKYTKLTNLEVGDLKASTITGTLASTFKGPLNGTVKVAKADSYSLTAAEKNNIVFLASMSDASKVLTLGLPEGQLVFVINTGGTNAISVKNVSGDTGTSVAAGKAILLVAGSSTADTNTVIALN